MKDPHSGDPMWHTRSAEWRGAQRRAEDTAKQLRRQIEPKLKGMGPEKRREMEGLIRSVEAAPRGMQVELLPVTPTPMDTPEAFVSRVFKETEQDTIAKAAEHADKGEMSSSAKLALSDARKLSAKGDHANAMNRARDSLKYSVGVLHPDYQKADALARKRTAPEGARRRPWYSFERTNRRNKFWPASILWIQYGSEM